MDVKVVFLADVPGHGRKGEVKDVSDGFARNFLFPRKLAEPATEGVLRHLAHEKEKHAQGEARKRKTALERKKALESLTLRIPVRLGESGRLHGAVTSQMIAEFLRERGIDVEKRQILLENPIRHPGAYVVPVKLYAEITAELRIEVVPEGEGR